MKRVVTMGTIGVLLITAVTAGAAEVPKRGEAKAVNVARGPVIDGTLNDAVWAECPPWPIGDCTSEKPLEHKTSAKVLFDGVNVYVGVICEDSDTEGLLVKAEKRDSDVWKDDSIDIFIQADAEKPYYQFTINPAGVLADAGNNDSAWNGDVTVKTAIQKGKAWTATIKIPMTDLSAYVGNDQTWTMNINRSRPARGGDRLMEYSWSVMNSTKFQSPAEFGIVTGIHVPERKDGVTRIRKAPAPQPNVMAAGKMVGGVKIYYKMSFDDDDRQGWEGTSGGKVTITDKAIHGKALRSDCSGKWAGMQLPLNIGGSRGLKIAGLITGKDVPAASVNIFDKTSGDNTTPYGHRRMVDGKWTPFLYFMDRCRYNSRDSGFVGPNTAYSEVRFYSPSEVVDGRWFAIDNFVVYRGTDRLPPAAVEGLKAETHREGVRLSWLPAEDNVGAQVYVISRAGSDGKFEKIAESHITSYMDGTAGPGTFLYRVLAVDFEENVGPWSETVKVKSKAKTVPRELTRYEQDRLDFAEHVKEVHARGVGKVRKGHAVLFGDSLTGATMYPHTVRAALLNCTVDALGVASMTTTFGKNTAPAFVARENPEYMFILYGTNNRKDQSRIPEAMDDLAAIVKTCEDNGTVAVLGTIPTKGWTPDSAPEANFNKHVIELCRKLDIPTGYIFEAFQEKGHENRHTYMGDDGTHWKGEGMMLGAVAWASALEQVRFVMRDGGIPQDVGVAPAAKVEADRVPIADQVRLNATADIWLSSAVWQDGDERETSMGKSSRLKLKTIQEMAAIRFDATPIAGREVKQATLHMRRQGDDKLRYILVSTVAQDWREGDTSVDYGKGSGSCYNYADFDTKKAWSWSDSQFCDVSMTSGHTIMHWAECRKSDDGWISVDLSPDLIYSLVAGDTDGLAIMDGGTPDMNNNFVHSVQSKGNEPFITVVPGGRLETVPALPVVKAEPAPERSRVGVGALKLTIAEDPNVLCWRLKLSGEPVPRWKVAHPADSGPTTFIVEDLPSDQEANLEIIAVSRSGKTSAPVMTQVTTSRALPVDIKLAEFKEPAPVAAPPAPKGAIRVWALPGLVKLAPDAAKAVCNDIGVDGKDFKQANAVWDGKNVKLFGARGEYVSYQLCIEIPDSKPIADVKILPGELKGAKGGVIGGSEIELYRNWYALNAAAKWQPSFCIPTKAGESLSVPDVGRSGEVKTARGQGGKGGESVAFPAQQNQTIYVDVYIPKDARPGAYSGSIAVQVAGNEAASLPVQLEVLDFELPDKLSFWPELNDYGVPRDHIAYWRLAHQHRCVANIWVIRPQVTGRGKDIKVIWDKYDKMVSELLSGKAFADNRRAGVPTPCMYLPFEDSWPTPLSMENYSYTGRWSGDEEIVEEHYMTSPYIATALSQEYKDAFWAVQKQFVEHFKKKGWTKTEMQCFYGGKISHRVEYRSNIWWRTDEPYYWDDWLALQFFCRLWTEGRQALGADRTQWAARGDISQVQWQGRIFHGILDTQYGGLGKAANSRRLRTVRELDGVKINDYGSAGRDNESNLGSAIMLLSVWFSGGDAHLPWKTIGSAKALDLGDSQGSGNSLMVPGARFGLPVVGDMRLKGLRDGQQLIEYMTLLAERRGLKREQVTAIVKRAIDVSYGHKAGARLEDADAKAVSSMKAWQFSELRRTLAQEITRKESE